MSLLIKNITIKDKLSPLNEKVVDLLIKNGIIEKISEESINPGDTEVFDGSDLMVSPGWVDIGVHFKDPGYEWLETLEELALTASYGGFTHLIGFPNTNPAVQTKEGLSYFQNFSKFSPVELHNLAAVTINCKGDDFTDIMDLYRHGAVGFSDGRKIIENSDIFLKALIYLHPLNAALVVKSRDKYLSMYGQMHEGVNSTLLGMKGIPSASEELMIVRNLKLLEYSGVKSDKPVLHFSTISTKGSVQLIREAKAKGLPVSCDVAAHHLEFTDDSLLGFDTNFKVNPPFRTSEDINALKKGLEEGVIDAIVSDHNAWDEEHKNLEFDHAEFGAVGLQTVFPVALKNLSIETVLEKLVYTPRTLFKLAMSPIKEGEKADLTLFDTDSKYIITKETIKSKAVNSPFLNQELTGRARAVYNNGYFKVINS